MIGAEKLGESMEKRIQIEGSTGLTEATGTADLLIKVNNPHPPQHKQAIEVELEQPEAEMEGAMREQMKSCKMEKAESEDIDDDWNNSCQ